MILLLMSLMGLAETDSPHLLYFIMVDRFENGSKTNDSVVDLNAQDAMHGGDLVGISKRVDHLQSMGVDWVWLSPIFDFRKENYMGHAAFHGYWTNSLDKVEPHLGSEKDLLELQRALKDRQIHLVLDMVYNHVAMDSEFTRIHADWFHPSKPINDWNDIDDLTKGSVHGLPDLNQSREPLYMYFKHRTDYWLKKSRAVGIRIDALKHMKTSFIQRLQEDLKKNHPNLWILGEDFDGNPITLAKRAHETQTDALFDFPMHYAMTDVFCKNQSVSRLAVTLSMDSNYPDGLKMVTFLDNHDLPRIDSVCPTAQDVRNALSFQFALRGLPMITYGFEAGLKGIKEPQNRGDMKWESHDDRIESIKKLRDLRATHSTLENGRGAILELEDEWLVYAQHKGNTQTLVAINRGNNPRTPVVKGKIIDGWTSNGMKRTTNPVVEPNSVTTLILNGNNETTNDQIERVQFEVSGSTSAPIVVGSHHAFGHWNPEKGLKLTQKNGKWVGEALIKKGTAVAWKLVISNANGITWEPGDNRVLWNDKTVKVSLRE